MPGKLYVVGTPIGNLEDITYRAVRILSEADFICAEDTRVTMKLLNHFEIKKPLISYHEHSAAQVLERITDKLSAGESCAVVTDAGMPCISDPGADLVAKCMDMGIDVEAVPGPTAVATAAAVCGIPAARFSFEGFLSVTKKQRFDRLRTVSRDDRTLIFYEAPHKLKATLADMLECFGDRKISVCRELTKIHEEVVRTTISEAMRMYEDKNPRGEYVLVIEGCGKSFGDCAYSIDDAVNAAVKLMENGAKMSEACKEAAQITGLKKNDIYSALLQN
ncbi:MAG: 16S rRNA (cytidine(1402)-2'-O)-methyltransferase [Ruminococcus sp.]|nr:16S rRNA (cytidine(1402)-2'-O)-methyltransferase [Ruminococcus sp.]